MNSIAIRRAWLLEFSREGAGRLRQDLAKIPENIAHDEVSSDFRLRLMKNPIKTTSAPVFLLTIGRRASIFVSNVNNGAFGLRALGDRVGGGFPVILTIDPLTSKDIGPAVGCYIVRPLPCRLLSLCEDRGVGDSMTDAVSGGVDGANRESGDESAEAIAAAQEKTSQALTSLRREVVLQRRLLIALILGVTVYFAFPTALKEYGGPLLGLSKGAGAVSQFNAVEYGTYNRKGERVILQNDDKWGLPTLFFFDLKKRCKMMARIAPEGGGAPIVELYDENGPRVALSLDGDGTSSVRLFGKQHQGGIALSVTEDGTPSLVMSKPTGEVILTLPQRADVSNLKNDSNSSNNQGRLH